MPATAVHGRRSAQFNSYFREIVAVRYDDAVLLDARGNIVLYEQDTTSVLNILTGLHHRKGNLRDAYA